MKNTLYAVLIIAFLLAAFPQSAQAAPGSPLCLPGPQFQQANNCQPLGPSDYLSRMASLGLTFPLRQLPSSQPDSNLAFLPYFYARVTAEEGRVYSSLEDAVVGKPVASYIEGGFDFVSYIDVREVDGKKFYLISPGQWMRGNDLSAGVAYSQFMGLEFSYTPSREFGWILQPVQGRLQAGLAAEISNNWFARWDVIQVFDKKEVDGLTWYMVAPDLWVESREAALVVPATQAPEGVENGRWIEINLEQQTMSVYDDNHLVYATLTATGLPGVWTRPGLFQIYQKDETTPMTGSFTVDRSDYYYLEDVPWAMYFDEARAFHGAYWHNNFGYESSKGCANLSSGDSRWLFDWASLGDWVYVWDPSGNTPTDPSLYGSGGA
jgi:hypothetical protein